MKTKAMVSKVVRDRKFVKNVVGMPEKDMDELVQKGFPVAYIYEVYPYGGGDDQVSMVAFKEALSDEQLQKRFTSSKIRGTLFGAVCEVDLRVKEASA